MRTYNTTPQIDMIEGRNFKEYRKSSSSYEKNIFETTEEFTDFCRTIDLKEIFGFSEKFDCIFHQDKTKSASIYKMGHDWLYTCHSANCQLHHHTLNIFGIIMNVCDCNYREAQVLLMNWLNCEIRSCGSTESAQLSENNIKILRLMPALAPTTFKIIGTDLQVIEEIYKIIGEQKFSVFEKQDIIIGESTRYIQSRLKKQVKVSRALALFSYVGLIRRIPIYEVPQSRFEKAFLLSKKIGQQRLVSQIAVKWLTEEDLTTVEALAIQWKQLYNKNSFTYKKICENEGVFKANLLFPQK